MQFCIQLRLASLIAFMFAGFATSAQATVIVNAVETGGDVVISGGGTLDRSEWGGLQAPGTMDNGRVDANDVILLGTGTAVEVDVRTGAPASFTGPSMIGTGTAEFTADSGAQSGDVFGIVFGASGPTLILPDAAPLVASVNGSSTYTGQDFASLGLNIGSYTWSWGTGGTADSFTLNVVPEPSTAALTALGLIGLALRRRRP